MQEKKPASRGVVDSIAALRELRYMTKGPGAKRRSPAKPSIEKLRVDVAKVAKKKTKGRRR